MDLKCLRSSGVVFLQFYAAQLKYNSFAGFLVALFRLLMSFGWLPPQKFWLFSMKLCPLLFVLRFIAMTARRLLDLHELPRPTTLISFSGLGL